MGRPRGSTRETTFASALALIDECPATHAELAEMLSCTQRNVRRIVAALAAHGLVSVERVDGHHTMVHALVEIVRKPVPAVRRPPPPQRRSA